MEMLTKTNSNHQDLRSYHVWGCPVYVLKSKLQNNQKLPKWNQRSRLGKFLDFSEEHSKLVANVRHLQTGYIYPQYNPVFDDLSETAVRLTLSLTIFAAQFSIQEETGKLKKNLTLYVN